MFYGPNSGVNNGFADWICMNMYPSAISPHDNRICKALRSETNISAALSSYIAE